MKKVLLIATGGTIASKQTDNGSLAPDITSEELLEYVPEAKDICQVTAYQLYNLDSTNICYEHWIGMAKCIEQNYQKYDAFVITHGTDTMAYTAAALSYMISNNRKPVLLTGSQKSIYLRDNDARNNLINALIFACDDMSTGVHILFDNKVILGTRARKTRTKSYNAFTSIDFPEVAIVDGKVRRYIEESEQSEVKFCCVARPSLFVVKMFPGMDSSIIGLIGNQYDAIVLEGFGVGGMPNYDSDGFYQEIRRLIDNGKIIVMTTQVTHEGSDMTRYAVGHRLAKLGVIDAEDMTLESIVAKLMWLLGRNLNRNHLIKEFLTPIRWDRLQ